MTIEKQMETYFDRLYPICRSISGEGYQESLDIIREIIPLEKIDFASGTECYDWTVPDEWTIRDAYITGPDGKTFARFKDNNLHVVGYSLPIDKKMTLDQLKKHLHTLKELPEAIPYVTSYYKQNWGFCLSYNKYKNLEEGSYRVFIDSELKPGKLTIGVLTIPGKTNQEILLSTYLCHPSMAVNELSGPLVTAFLYKKLLKEKRFRHTIRFVFCPENIGAIAFLSKFGRELKNRLIAGYVINCVGHGDIYTYKKSRRGNTLADRAALNVLKHQKLPLEVIDFFPDGSDERQYCSPGFNFPIGLIMRTMYGKYKEYHTSLDNKELISFKIMKESVNIYWEVIKTIEENTIYKNRIQYGTPQFSKSKVPLYPNTMVSNKYNEHGVELNKMLAMINYCDGENDLLQVADDKDYKMLEMIKTRDNLIKAGYLIKSV